MSALPQDIQPTNDSVIIDVREKDEFAVKHVENSINIPLSVFSSIAPGMLNQLKSHDVIFMCHSGARAQQAQAIASGLGYNDAHQYSVYTGGIQAWIKAGNAVEKSEFNAPLPLIRQVQLVIGLLVIALGILGATISPFYAYAAAAVGAGVFLAGATGFCALATLVSKLPWNRGDIMARRTMCQASSGNNC